MLSLLYFQHHATVVLHAIHLTQVLALFLVIGICRQRLELYFIIVSSNTQMKTNYIGNLDKFLAQPNDIFGTSKEIERSDLKIFQGYTPPYKRVVYNQVVLNLSKSYENKILDL